jgi:hypothetical protein
MTPSSIAFAGSSGLNKSKGGEKRQQPLPPVDDTNQPGSKATSSSVRHHFQRDILGVKRQDWSRPNQITNNDTQYGKGGKPDDARSSSRSDK